MMLLIQSVRDSGFARHRQTQAKLQRQKAVAKAIETASRQLSKLTVVGAEHPQALEAIIDRIQASGGFALNYGSQCMLDPNGCGKKLVHNLTVAYVADVAVVARLNVLLSKLNSTTHICDIPVCNPMIAVVDTVNLPKAFAQATGYLAKRQVDLVNVHGRLKRSAGGDHRRSMSMLLDAPAGVSDVELENAWKAECPASARIEVHRISLLKSADKSGAIPAMTDASEPFGSWPISESDSCSLWRLNVLGQNRVGMLSESLSRLEAEGALAISFHGDRAAYDKSEGLSRGRVSILFQHSGGRGLTLALNQLDGLGAVHVDKYSVNAPAVLNCAASYAAPLESISRTGADEILSVAGEWQIDRQGCSASQLINVVFSHAPQLPSSRPFQGGMPPVMSPAGA